MGRITELQLRDVRCFEGKQSAKIGRITLLLGQHNAGKSTFLGCYQTLAQLANLVDLDDKNYFNDPPFLMGHYDSIARSDKPSLTVGGRFDGHCHTRAAFTFLRGHNAALIEQKLRLEFNGRFGETRTLDIERQRNRNTFQFKESNLCFELDQSEVSYASISTWLSRAARRGILPYHGEPSDFRRRHHSLYPHSSDVEFGKFVSFLRADLPLPRRASFAIEAPDPNISYPRKRWYLSPPDYLDPIGSGDLTYLSDAGNKLGLWDEISTPYDPRTQRFEVRVSCGGSQRNLIDVGYGIHSILPLLHSINSKSRGTVFLLQQPEVHLHPSAQASLAQFMAESDAEFLIETHSEHFTDRFRICVLEGVLQPEDLSIIYFDLSQNGRSSQIHSIEVDTDANLLNVPNNYRSFFWTETERLLGFST